MAEDAIAVLDGLQIKKANILGISMGGRIALALCLNHQKRVKRLILTCTFAGRTNKPLSLILIRLLYPLRRLIFFKAKYNQPRYAFFRQALATLNFDCVDRLSEIRIPTLILHGQTDRTVPFKNALQLNKAIRQSVLQVFKGGHLFFILEEKQEYLDSLTSWLAN